MTDILFYHSSLTVILYIYLSIDYYLYYPHSVSTMVICMAWLEIKGKNLESFEGFP